MSDLLDLAGAILEKKPLTEDQAKLYAAVHVVTNGVAYGAVRVDAKLLDLLDARVENDPYTPEPITTPGASAPDELAQLRKQMAELQAMFANAKTAPATNKPSPSAPPDETGHAPGAN